MNTCNEISPKLEVSENSENFQDDLDGDDRQSMDSPNGSSEGMNNAARFSDDNAMNLSDSKDDQSIKRKNKREHRKCTVCGDRALGFNFDAITCESCKAFFRRNANKTKQPKCMFQGACSIDANTRRFCSACRLKKCFVVGMKKEMILGEDERKRRIQKVLQNRAKKLQQLQSPTASDGSTTSLSSLCIKIEESACNDSATKSTSSTLWPTVNNPNSNSEESPGEKPVDAGPYHRLLSDSEMTLLESLENAYCSSFGSTSDEVPLMPEATTLEVLMNHIGILVKLLIRFAKKLNDFNVLHQDAQVNLLKGSLLDCICWRSAQLFNLEQGNWVNHEGTEVPLNVLSAAFGQVDPNVQDEYVSVFTMIKQLIGSNMALISIIQCIVLFSPEYSANGHRSVTSSTQEKYIVLLKHYLEAHHDWTTSFSMFSRVMTSINRVKQYTMKHSKALHQCDATQVEPLLLEVFNISSAK